MMAQLFWLNNEVSESYSFMFVIGRLANEMGVKLEVLLLFLSLILTLDFMI